MIDEYREDDVQKLLDYCQANNRVCPLPIYWNQLYEMLPDKRRVNSGCEPPMPLILAAWDSPNIYKVLRLQEHILWAQRHNVLNKVSEYLFKLPEQAWFHNNE